MTQPPDIRVRLSAEGQAEVIAALKKVQAEGQKTTRETARGFSGLSSVFGNLKGLVAGLGVALSARAFIGFIRGSAQMVGAMHETAQAIGTTTENVSALDFAARHAGVEIRRLHTALPVLARNLMEAAQGSGTAAKALRQLETVSPGLKKALLSTSDSAEQLAILSQAFAKLPDSTTKSALAMQIFGRAGAALLPLINELGQKGLPTLKREAGAAGQLVSNELSRAVDQATDQMEALRTQTQILGAQFLVGLAPDLRRALGMISEDLKKSSDDMTQWGRVVGAVIGSVVLGTAAFFGGVSRVKERLEAIRDLWRNVFHPEMQNDVAGKGAWHPPEISTDQTNVDLMEMESQKILQVQKAAIDNEISLLKAKNTLRNEEEKQAFAAGLTTVQQHYAARREIITKALEAEIAALLRKKALLAGEEDDATRQKEQAAIDARIAELRVDAATEGLRLNAEELKAVRELGEDRAAIEKRILELQGDRHAAAMMDIDAEIAAAREKLKLPFGPLTAEQQGLLDALHARLDAREAFEEAQRAAEAGMASMEIARARVQAQMDAGLVSQADGERQLLEIERGRIGALETLAQKLAAAAQATGDADLIRQAEEFRNSIIGIGASVSELDRLIQDLGPSIRAALTDDLANWLGQGIEMTDNLGSAFRKLAVDVLSSIRRITSQIIASKIVSFLTRSGGAAASVSAGGGLLGIAPVRRFSAGGFLSGPGTGTSDSLVGLTDGGLPARFSRGEFVTRASVVSQPGALQLLENMNRWGMASIRPITHSAPRFAEGGIVKGGAAGSQSWEGRMQIGLDDGLVLRALETPAGERVMFRLLAKNRRATRTVIGG